MQGLLFTLAGLPFGSPRFRVEEFSTEGFGFHGISDFRVEG